MHTDRCGKTRRQKCCAEGSGNKFKYNSLCIEIKRIWNLKCTIMPVITGAIGIVKKSLRRNLEAVPGKHSIDSLQKTAILGTSHIIRKVLQCEAWSLRGGDHCWFKRITKKKRPVTRDIIKCNNNNNNNNNNNVWSVTNGKNKRKYVGSEGLYNTDGKCRFNPLNPELNPICYLLVLLAHHFLHVSRIRVKLLTFRRLMSYTYGAPILDVSRSHTTTQHSR